MPPVFGILSGIFSIPEAKLILIGFDLHINHLACIF